MGDTDLPQQQIGICAEEEGVKFTLRKEPASESEVSHSTRSKQAQERTGDSRSENARQSILPLAKWRVLPVDADSQTSPTKELHITNF